MRTSRFSDTQIIYTLKQAQAGTPVPQLCREHGISTFYSQMVSEQTHRKSKTNYVLDGSLTPVAAMQDNAQYDFYKDHLGTVHNVTDSNGSNVWSGDYSTFGAVTETDNGYKHNLRFAGQYHDRESGLYYNYYRDYDSSLGRYVQSDPIGLMAGLNTYAYVGGNPVGFVDPTGENPVVVAGAVIGGAAICYSVVRFVNLYADATKKAKRQNWYTRQYYGTAASENYSHASGYNSQRNAHVRNEFAPAVQSSIEAGTKLPNTIYSGPAPMSKGDFASESVRVFDIIPPNSSSQEGGVECESCNN